MTLSFHFALRAEPAGGYAVTLRVNDGQPVPGAFHFRPQGAAVEAALDEIADGNPSRDTITHVGEELWVGLVNGVVLTTFEEAFWARPAGTQTLLRLSVPAELRWLPWEALYYRRLGFLCGTDDCAVVHAPGDLANVPPATAPKAGPLRMLIIIPERSKLDVQPERESIARLFKTLGGGPPRVLDGRVLPETLHRCLSEGWDIVHFIGHGAVNADGRVEIDLNRPDGTPWPYDAEEFAQSVAAAQVRLAVLNCCHGNLGDDDAGLSGFGPLLMRKGVPAAVAMQYAIGNDMARQFSDTFYENLFAGKAAGRVERAVEEARGALRRAAGSDTQRAFLTPVLHLAAGYEQLFAIAPKAVGPVVIGPTPTADAEALPAKLVAALRDGRCVPVVGPGVLRPPALRDAAPRIHTPHGPRELAEQFAVDARHPYPRDADMSLCDSAGDWMSAHLLQWVSQHNVAKEKSSGELVAAIQRHYATTPAPALVREIALWKVPALFYTHFDGYLEACVLSRESWLDNVVYEFDKPLAQAPQGEHGPRSLVLVRGSHSKSDDYPLVLTEDDHDELAGRIARLDPQLKTVARKANRSVLFLGVGPRDPVVRQLSQQLLVAGSKRQQGPTFFACPGPDDVDCAYWDKYAVAWLRQDLTTLVRLVSEALKGA